MSIEMKDYLKMFFKEYFALLKNTLKHLFRFFFTREDFSLISPEGREILNNPEKKKIFFDAMKEADEERAKNNTKDNIRKELSFPDGTKMVVLI
nr:MAG TPA: Urease subunit gamma [Caudoviricetes sp.]